MSKKMNVGFIGLGMMGKSMSKRILGGGFPLTVYDIRPEPVEELVRAGAKRAMSAKEVAEASDVVLTSLPTSEACKEVYLGDNGLLKGARPGETLVETSTVAPSMVRRLSEEAKKQGVILFDAALYGRSFFHPGRSDLSTVEMANEGLITVMVGSDPVDLERVRPVLATFGKA